MSIEKLIVFARYPEPGKAKTRLVPALGPRGAAELYRRLAEHTVHQGRILARDRALTLVLCHQGGDKERFQTWLGPDLPLRPQVEGDLGRRLTQAFHDAFVEGASRVVTTGSDCPDLSAHHLAAAFESLRHHDLVLGPARDGGYYLIGLSRPAKRLFAGIPWSSARVLEETRRRAEELNLTAFELEVLNDIDRPEDLAYARSFAPNGREERMPGQENAL